MNNTVNNSVVFKTAAHIAVILQATLGFLTNVQVGANPFIPTWGAPQPRFRQKIMRI